MARDKVLHFFTSVPLGIVIAYYSSSLVIVLVSGVMVGVMKESYDWWMNREAMKAGERAPHSVEVWDVLATALGAVVGGFVTLFGMGFAWVQLFGIGFDML